MDTDVIQRAFRRMGAEIAIGPAAAALRHPRIRWGARAAQPLSYEVDVVHRGKADVFTLAVRPDADVDVHVADVQPEMRHLLLMVRENAGDGAGDTSRFLCGHDERNWFVAACPGGSNVRQAMESLKPAMVRQAQASRAVRTRKRNRRRNPAFVRQGEWFFLPMPDLVVDAARVRRDEPLRRGAGKAHAAEQAYRIGGRRVWVCWRYPDGITEQQYRQVLIDEPQAKAWRWQEMLREPQVYVRGAVRHDDHKTVVLPCWHRVLPNTEDKTAARANLAFLD